MKTRYFFYPALTCLGAAVLILVAIKTAGTSLDWLAANLFIPGRLLAAAMFHQAAGTPKPPLQFLAEFALNFVITWFGLMFGIFFLDRLIATLYELTKV
jgi:hypothetical protein